MKRTITEIKNSKICISQIGDGMFYLLNVSISGIAVFEGTISKFKWGAQFVVMQFSTNMKKIGSNSSKETRLLKCHVHFKSLF